ncbi:BQ2448_3015 [Microbotryum intermedium]|uniref:BQ2448_3015 protein n=1 Tax=Microbotryum intermedium TaxID=269621 RepID=A0A238FDY9_9BASI|nr:BQ2448_3015 [Microbotryum intermedium]
MSIHPPPPIPPITPTRSTQLVSSMLNESIAVLIASDARLVIGSFTCLDHQGNLVLNETYEYPASGSEKEQGWHKQRRDFPVHRLTSRQARSIGMVMVPRKEWGGVWLHTPGASGATSNAETSQD